MPVHAQPVVLLPQGPYGWDSHRAIVPQLVSVWHSLGFTLMPTWFPNPRWSFSELEILANSNLIIFGLGHSHYQSLETLRLLRSVYKITTPVCWMYTSDIHNRMHHLREASDLLTEDDHLIVSSTAEARLVRAFFPKLVCAAQVIPLSVDEAVFHPVNSHHRTRLRKQLQLTSESRYLLYAGRISTQKNIVSLLSVFAELARSDQALRLLLLGASDDLGVPHFSFNKRRCLHEVNLAVTALNLKNKVEFRPSVSQEALAEYFHACDVHVSLTVHSCEEFGYAIAQGLACAVPTVVTRWGGGVDLAQHGYGINVGNSYLGPSVDHRMAVSQIRAALDAHRANDERKISKRWQRELSASAIAQRWLALSRARQKLLRPKARAIKTPKLRHSNSSLKPFKNGFDVDFKKFVKSYSGGQDLTGRRCYVHPLWRGLNENQDYLRTELAKIGLTLRDQNAFVRCLGQHDSEKLLTRVPGLSRKAHALLLRSGILCPEIQKSRDSK